MADHSKTEKATPKRRGEARSKGQVARSPEVNSAAVLAAGVATLALAGPRIFRGLRDMLEHGLAQAGNFGLATESGLPSLARSAFLAFLAAVGPILFATAAAGFLASVAQVRFKVT